MSERVRSEAERVQRSLYRELLRHALVRLVLLYFIPLLLLALFFHLQYRLFIRDTEERHLQSLAAHQAAMLEGFLGDRLLNLTGLTDDPLALVRPSPVFLQASLAELQGINESFVDLAVLDAGGGVLEYAGPFPELKGRNYAAESWFVRLKEGDASHVITDVYLGFRGLPHFTMAVKLEPGGQTRVLRAALSPEAALARTGADDEPAPSPGGLRRDFTTNIWIFTGLFCLTGGVVVFVQARWVAHQQFQARQKERQLNRQLVHAARLASVGELASGIAHEINNPLAVVAEKAGLIKDLLDPAFGRNPSPGEIVSHLEAIETAVYRCTGITRQLLGFVRQTGVSLKATDVHQLIDDLLDGLMGPELKIKGVTVVRDFDRTLPPVITDAERLRQVLVNLVKNAVDAIPGAGTVTLATRRQASSFIITVKDTGVGLTPEQHEKIFLPFFTTKPPGKGTGLGLSVSYGIIEGLGGSLGAAGAPGEGSEFTIELPLDRA